MSCVKVFDLRSQRHHDLIGVHPATGQPWVAVGRGSWVISATDVCHVRTPCGDMSWQQYLANLATGTIGYVVKGPDGPSTQLHQTRATAEAEAQRLATGLTGKQFTVHPVTRGAAVSRAHTPKPSVTLEKLDG